MKPPPFDYVRPGSLSEALEILSSVGEEGTVLAGGQSLIPAMNFRLARPGVLIDIGGMSELDTVFEEEKQLVIGAGVRQREAELHDLVLRTCRALPLALRHVGHLQNRNRGTVCGSLAHADPAAELPAVALALEAKVTLESVRGRRLVSSEDLFLGAFSTEIEDDEIMVDARFPIDTDTTRVIVDEVAQRSGDFAIAGLILRVDLQGETVVDPRVVAFGVAPTAVRLRTVEAAMSGQRLGDRMGDEVEEAVRSDLPEPTDDVQADGAYRQEAIGALVKRAVRAFAG